MKGKKMLAVLLGAAMVVSMAACGSVSSSEETDVSDETGDISEEESGDVSAEEKSDVLAEEEASADEVEGVSGEYSAADLGIAEEDMEKIYAVLAYELSAHDLDATYNVKTALPTGKSCLLVMLFF